MVGYQLLGGAGYPPPYLGDRGKPWEVSRDLQQRPKSFGLDRSRYTC
jgi:hypothetical protein